MTNPVRINYVEGGEKSLMLSLVLNVSFKVII